MTMRGRRKTWASPSSDVVGHVRVHGRDDLGFPGPDGGQRLHEVALVVALGEALATHEVASLQDGVGVEETVGGEELDLGVAFALAQERLQHACRGALADGHAAGDADDERGVGRLRVQEGGHLLVGLAFGGGQHGEELGQGKVDLRHLFGRHRFAGGGQPLGLGGREGIAGALAQRRPFGSAERFESAGGGGRLGA